MLKIKNNTTNFTQDLKNYFVNEPQKTQEIAESKISSSKMGRLQTTKFFYPKNGLYGLL
jgi:hypothetical protein